MKKHFVMVGITLVLLAVGLCGCTQEDALSGLAYVDRENGFGLNPPAGWRTNTSNTTNAVVFETNSKEGYLVSLGVSLTTATPEDSLASIINELRQVFDANPNSSILGNTTRTVNKRTAHELIILFTFDLSDVQQKKYVLLKKGDTLFILLYSAPVEVYDTYLEPVEESIKSFTIV